MKNAPFVSSHLPQRSQAVLEPRKSPVQARSTASVEAILEATVQVLLDAGKERLTTTRVASRAGVSVGTLYQYFPNKSALLQAALRHHLEEVTEAVERVAREQKGNIAQQMGARVNKAVVQMLSTACDPLTKDVQLIASILQGAMAGVSWRLIEST